MASVRVTYPALSRADVVEQLKEAYNRIGKKLPVSQMILFGSYAENRYTANSDIDVLVVYGGRERDDAYKVVADEARLPRLEPRVYTEEQFAALMAGSPKFAETLAKQGIVIRGVRGRGWLKGAKTG